jgi:hypothetical protein
MYSTHFMREQHIAHEAPSERTSDDEDFAHFVYHADAFFPALMESPKVFRLMRYGSFRILPSASR